MTSRQRKTQKAQQAFRNELGPGDEVMTSSGLFGTVVEVDEDNDRITIEAAGSRTVWLRAAINKRISTPASSEHEVKHEANQAGTISPASPIAVPDDISGLDTAQREYREQKRKDAEGK
jgi:preprotein translocase subunit YajC